MAILDGGFLIYPAALAAGFWLLRRYVKEREFQSFAAQHGCRPLPHSGSWVPFALDRMWTALRVVDARGDVMEELFFPSFRAMGWTFSSAGAFGETNIMTADPANMRAVLATQFHDFSTGASRMGSFGYLLGKCLFTVDGEEWERSRAMFRPHFARGEINDMDIEKTAADELVYAIKTYMEEGEAWTGEVNLQTLFLRLTLDSGTEFFFGANVKSQLGAIPGARVNVDPDLAEIGKMVVAGQAGEGELSFGEAFHTASAQVRARGNAGDYAFLFRSSKADRAVKYLQTFMDFLIARAHAKGRGKTSTGKHTWLETLSRDIPDPEELRNQSLFLFTAARDTTAGTLSFLFLLLAKHKSAFQKLRAAVLADFGTKDEPKEIAFYNLKKCQYLQWCLYETLRLFPPGPINLRVAERDTVLPTGGGPDGKSPIAVRKGQKVLLGFYVMQRRSDIWGEDAAEFRPERWEGRQADGTFLSFSGGPRICLGSELHPTPFSMTTSLASFLLFEFCRISCSLLANGYFLYRRVCPCGGCIGDRADASGI